MKTALHLLFAGSLFLFASCSGGYKLANTAPNDDVYAQSESKQAPTETYVPQEQTNPNIGDNSGRADQYSDKRVDENGDTYVTNNYYGNDYSFDNYDEDYYYSRNLRRWYDPYQGFGYYSNVYANPYFWGPSFYGSGMSVTLSFGSYYPWYWRPAYYSYYPWYTPYPYYSYYNPYYNPYGYASGYNAGYWNGYNDGYWGNPYGYNGYYNYYDNNGGGYYGNGNNWSNTYYGHRGGNIFSNTNTVAESGGLGGRFDGVQQSDGGRVNADVKGRTTNTTPTSVGKTETGKQNAGTAAERYTGKDVQKETGAQTGRPNTQQPTKSNEPTNTERVKGFDANPNVQKNNTQQPHKGSTSIDVNPNTQVKPQPNVRDNNQQMPQPQPRYQWESPAQNEQRNTQPAQPSQPRYEQPQPRSNQYESPRNTYEQPRQQDNDEYVPRQNEQPVYQAPRNESPRFEAPRPAVPDSRSQPQYEAPRQQPRVETPKQNDGPVLKSAPRDNSGNDRSNDSPRGRRPH